MLEFRQVLTMRRFTVLIFFAVTAWAQQRPFTCNPAVPVIPTIRMEGVTEMTGDILITCTGGSPAPAGQFVPLTNLTVTLNANVTSRILSNGASEALLLLDEPTNQSPVSLRLQAVPSPARRNQLTTAHPAIPIFSRRKSAFRRPRSPGTACL